MKVVSQVIHFPVSLLTTDISIANVVSKQRKIALEKLEKAVYLLSLLIFLSFFFLGYLKANSFYFLLGFLLFVSFPLLFFLVLKIKVSKIILQYELDLIIHLLQINVLNKTTKSEIQALLLLSKSTNPLISDIGKNAFIEKTIRYPTPSIAINKILKTHFYSPINSHLMNLFSNFGKNSNMPFISKKVSHLVSNKLLEDKKNTENNVVILNALFSVIPLFLIIFIFFSVKDPHPILEIVIFGFIIMSGVLYHIDPLRIKNVKEVIHFGDDYSKGNKSKILFDLESKLTLTRNINRAIQSVIFKNSYLDSLDDFSNLTKKGLLNGRQNLLENSLSIIERKYGSYFTTLLKIISNSAKIDIDATLNMFNLFAETYSIMENHYLEKKTILISEKKKTFLILIINSISIGIMSVLIPFLSDLSSINFNSVETIHGVGFLPSTLSILVILELWILILLLCLTYFFVFSVTKRKNILKYALIITFSYFIGVSFSTMTFISLVYKI